MRASPRMYTLIAGLALILSVNAVVLVGVAYNRSGEPESALLLTQRELAPPRPWGFEGENSGIALRLQWRVLREDVYEPSGMVIGNAGFGGAPDWLNKAKLAALGFDVANLDDTPEDRKRYGKLLPKDVLLVLELDGPAWRAALERARRHLEKEEMLLAANGGKEEFEQRTRLASKQLLWEEHRNSRLFVIDADLDAQALRAKYPDRSRYAIMRGQVRPQVSEIEKELRLVGYVNDISIDHIHVPLPYRKVLEPMLESAHANQDGSVSPSSYEVSVEFGKRFEPWITAVSGKTDFDISRP